MGVFDNETGRQKYVKKVDTGFYNSSGSLAPFFSDPIPTYINNVEYYTSIINVHASEPQLKGTLTPGTSILDLIGSDVNEPQKIYVMKNDEENTENYLSATVTTDLFTKMFYHVGTNSIRQALTTVSIVRENGNIRMASYYTLINNIQVDFVGWLYTRQTSQLDSQGAPIVQVTGVFVDYKFWEQGKVPPFGDSTPGGVIGGYGTYDDTSDNFPIPPNRLNDVYGSILSNVSGKIQMYTLDSTAYSAFLGKIYTSDFWDYWKNTIFNPIDGIYSCIRVPFSELDLTRTAVAKINVSNTELEILAGAYRVTNNFVYDKIIISNYAIDEYFGSFLDYAPHTTCELFIPFYGTVNLDINEIMGGNISITRRNNYVNGDFVVFVQCTNRFGVIVTHAYAGNAAMTLPITAGNDGSPNRILDLVQGVANLAMGNYVGAGSSAVNALTEKGSTSTVQKLSGGSGWNASHDFALIFRRVCPSNPENYTKENGRQADEFVKFSELSGYTEVSAVDMKFSSGKITSAEIDEINNLLKQGVFF